MDTDGNGVLRLFQTSGEKQKNLAHPLAIGVFDIF
jgi:hypothetical protein